LIKTDDPNHKDFINEVDERRTEYCVDKLPPGESIQCPDDKDTSIVKNPDGSIGIIINTATKHPFIR